MNIKQILYRSRAKVTLRLLSIITLLAFAATPQAWAESPSDLMEQGVYAEETKGDLANAEQLYQKVVEQGKSDQALAAQAQYHLGICYYKQNDFTAANNAFETVVKEYPGQTDLVAKARKYLAGAHPLQSAPWTPGEVMRLDIKLAGGLKVGVADYEARAGQSTNGQKTWRFTTHMVVGGIQSLSHVEVDADTMIPLHSTWKHSLLGEAEVTYYSDHADLNAAGKNEIKKLAFDSPVIDNEEAIEWMRRLPLTAGYTNETSVLTSLGSRVLPVTASVSGPEQVVVPSGAYSCYKIELSISQTFWYATDSNHYLVKFEGGGASAELTGVTHPAAGESVTYIDSTNGFSLTVPAGWSLDPNDPEGKSKARLTIIDPEGLTRSSLTVAGMDTLKPEQKKSLRDYVNEQLKFTAKAYKDFQIHAGGLQDRTVAGQPALVAASDFLEGREKMTGYGVWSFGGSNAVYFEMITSSKNFKAMQPHMEAIINSFKAQ